MGKIDLNELNSSTAKKLQNDQEKINLKEIDNIVSKSKDDFLNDLFAEDYTNDFEGEGAGFIEEGGNYEVTLVKVKDTETSTGNRLLRFIFKDVSTGKLLCNNFILEGITEDLAKTRVSILTGMLVTYLKVPKVWKGINEMIEYVNSNMPETHVKAEVTFPIDKKTGQESKFPNIKIKHLN